MIDNREEPIEDIEYFDKSRTFVIQTYRRHNPVNNININDIINETIMSKFNLNNY